MSSQRPQPARAKTLMFQGTSSDVGKSVITTAICRILHQDGWRVAPYKSQNMALNSYVTPDGKEIGRAQGVQAEACGLAATTDMNPILIKPSGEMTAQIVVHGKPHAEINARRYRKDYLPYAQAIVCEALERLRAEYEVVVLEGAGSPAEINLKDRDIVNMRMAAWAEAPVILVADIDRGGVFASIVGTLELLEPWERERVKGIVINKFRGDLSLLQPGVDWLEARTGLPVMGVIPYLGNLAIEAEDSVALDSRERYGNRRKSETELDIAVIRLPHISNFTDVDPLAWEQGSAVRLVSRAEELGEPDAVILPGTKNTLADLRVLREAGLADAVRQYALRGGSVAGLCGGYQMLGLRLSDPDQVESGELEVSGLGLLPLETVFYADKRTELARGSVICEHPYWRDNWQAPIEGYEIHMGRTAITLGHQGTAFYPLLRLEGQTEGWCSANGRVWGTYLHGIFDNDGFRTAWLNSLRLRRGLPPRPPAGDYRQHRTAAYDRLAAHVRNHLRMDLLYAVAGLDQADKVKS